VVTDILNFWKQVQARQVQVSVKQNQVSVKFKRAIQVSELQIILLLSSQIVIRIYLHKETFFSVLKMARSLELLELLNTLINTTEDNTVTLNKDNSSISANLFASDAS
jgi:hypothetical protein